MGLVTPLFQNQKDEELSQANYGLDTVLPARNDIYERISEVQLNEFYTSTLSDFISSYRKLHSCHTPLLNRRVQVNA